MNGEGYDLSKYVVQKEPFYLDIARETQLFKAAFQQKLPVILKGPTGCGKSRFMERMAWEINRELAGHDSGFPLVTVPCQEGLTADDLIGRYLIDGKWMDGPALVAVRHGGLLYLDEIVEARSDTTVVIHPLTDHRRILPVEKLGKVFEAPDNFMLGMSFNPGYQRKIKDLKMSTKQRFVAINFDYPPSDTEREIVVKESGVDEKTAGVLVEIGGNFRKAKKQGKLEEGASTRLLVNAAKLITAGVEPYRACEVAILNPITDDVDVQEALRGGLADVIRNYFPGR
ncbi:CbbQ/NirQ/NorQ/GpvN family protein [Candidatus Pacearchaeota archaeon]|nr:CbbQ/NirQ/NorQ/GpvN family protein [Candidatus Pacearchaeota archaeon]